MCLAFLWTVKTDCLASSCVYFCEHTYNFNCYHCLPGTVCYCEERESEEWVSCCSWVLKISKPRDCCLPQWNVICLTLGDRRVACSICVGSLAWNGETLSSGSRDHTILHRDIRWALWLSEWEHHWCCSWFLNFSSTYVTHKSSLFRAWSGRMREDQQHTKTTVDRSTPYFFSCRVANLKRCDRAANCCWLVRVEWCLPSLGACFLVTTRYGSWMARVHMC